MTDHGPSDDTLRRLGEMMHSMGSGMARGRIGGKGIPAMRKDRQDFSACKVCGTTFQSSLKKAEVGLCKTCDGLMKDGFCALVSPARFAFIKSPRFKPGEIVSVSEDVMHKVAEHQKAQHPEAPPQDGTASPHNN